MQRIAVKCSKLYYTKSLKANCNKEHAFKNKGFLPHCSTPTGKFTRTKDFISHLEYFPAVKQIIQGSTTFKSI